MIDLPSWCRRGQHVVCLSDAFAHMADFPHLDFPVLKARYVIRNLEISRFSGCIGLRLMEIVNPEVRCLSGLREPSFSIRAFAPIVSVPMGEDLALFEAIAELADGPGSLVPAAELRSQA